MRKIYDFTPEQLTNLTAIVWLYRGQSDRFLALVQQHMERTLTESTTALQTARWTYKNSRKCRTRAPL